MKYIMKSGTLYKDEDALTHIKGVFSGPEKKILSKDDKLLMQIKIKNNKPLAETAGNIHLRKYILYGKNGDMMCIANPDYVEGFDPSVSGWPICHMPRVDHADFTLCGKQYHLIMQNSQNYYLADEDGNKVIQIVHRGMVGGWDIETSEQFNPEMISAIFVLCKYIEEENEFLIV